jgi:multidrug efflux pump subunit AcrA (membrane-fusion protein)
MNMKPTAFTVSLARTLALALSLAAAPFLRAQHTHAHENAPQRAKAAEQLYTCGMHPQIIKKEPGNCPICGMKLTPVRSGAAPENAVAGGVHIDSATIQRMNLKTALVEHGPVRREIRAVGTVAYNEEGLRDITTKYEGWIEKLFVGATGVPVKAGEPLFEIYSPDLYNAQLNYVLAAKTEGDAGGSLTRAALARLQLFDVPADFIAEIRRAGEARRTFVFHAPADGVVVEKMAVAGQMMKPGERIYRLADLGTVWVLAQIYEKDLPFIRQGQAATVRSGYEAATRERAGTVELLLPQVDEQTRAATARIALPNEDGTLRPGMFVDVGFNAEIAGDAVLVPDNAVLRGGERNTVFVALDGGYFEPREIRLGARSAGDFYQVSDGLKAGERVVTSGQFLLDSESRLREEIQRLTRTDDGAKPAEPASAPAHTHGNGVGNVEALALAAADAAAALAGDDFAGYQAQLPALQNALAAHFAADAHAAHGALGKFKDGPGKPANIAAARDWFEPFSTAVSDVFRKQRAHVPASLRIFECGMAPKTGKARWLQRTAGARNPFFGPAMLECGVEIEPPATGARESSKPAPHHH